MNDPITLAQLVSIPFLIALVLLIVQVVKPLKYLQKVDTRLMVLVLALLLVVTVSILIGKTDATSIFLAILNGFVVASGAMGTYQVTFARADAAKKAGSDEGGAEAGP